jgi:hypothetical protein
MHEAQEGMRLEVGQEERAPVMQWVGLLLAPVTFFLHLQIGYVMIPWACVHNQNIWLHVVGIASVVLAALGCIAAWRTWMTGGRNVPGDHGGAIARTRMLGAIGLGIGALITMILFVQWVAALFIGVCQ